ncbi:MAG: DoxX family protein [Myxococcales bacterium]|nr:DoxX family protein [Myxococcales bacterium]
MLAIGSLHFIKPASFVAIIPEILPFKLALVYISGVFEILLGLGLFAERTRRLAAWGLVLLFIAVFPANINMAIHDIPVEGRHVHPALLWGRLPFQLVFIAWAVWIARRTPASATSQPSDASS